jgi:hypothetical protein
VPGHPILDLALDELRPTQTYGYDKTAAGPEFLDRLLKQHPEVTIFDAQLFYPRTAATRQRAYGVHHKTQTWKDAEWLREELDRFKGLLKESQDEAYELRLRCERAEAELRRAGRPSLRRLLRRPS